MISPEFIERLKTAIEVEDKGARKITSEQVLKEKKSQFDNYGANDWDDDPFPPIKESTIRRKGGNDRPLLRTGRLQKALYIDDEEDFLSLEVENVVDERGRPYKEHAEEFITKNSGTHYFNKLSDNEVQKAVETYIETFIEGLKKHAI